MINAGWYKVQLEARIAGTDQEPVLIHPTMADHYHEQVHHLHEALTDECRRTEAAAVIRHLVDHIDLTPAAINGKPGLAIDLHGHLPAILGLATKTGKPLENSEFPVESVELVAGAGLRTYLTPKLRISLRREPKHRAAA